MLFLFLSFLTLLHSERPKLHAILACLSATGLTEGHFLKKTTHKGRIRSDVAIKVYGKI